MNNYYHLLVTLFNVKETESVDIQELKKWTDRRYSIFEQYCLPSIVAQKNNKFNWLLLIDKDTQPDIKEKINNLVFQHDFIDAIELTQVSELVFKIKEYALRKQNNEQWLITTRVDNDDLLHEEYINEIQKHSKTGKKKTLLNFEKGYVLQILKQPNLLFETKLPQNPFISLIEPFNDQLVTVRKHIHNQWPADFHTINIKNEESLWIQLIHQENVLNHVQGKPVLQPASLQKFQLPNKIATHTNNKKHQLAKLNFYFNKVKRKLKV